MFQEAPSNMVLNIFNSIILNIKEKYYASYQIALWLLLARHHGMWESTYGQN